MRIESLTAGDLQKMIDNRNFLEGEVIPFTVHRAESQLLNPDLEKEDVILNVARNEQERIIGFIGALPGKLKDGTHFAWNSGWWVDPVRGREAAMPLFYAFLKQWDMRVMFSDLTPHTYRILKEMELFRTRITEGTRIYLRAPLSLVLPTKNRIYGFLKWLWEGIDFVANIFIDLRLGLITRGYKKSLSGRFREISSPDEEDAGLINEGASGNIGSRNIRHFAWIAYYPWLLTTEPDIQKKKYPFSSFVRQFDQKWIRVMCEGKVEALLLVTIRDRQLKIPYLFYRDEKCLHEAAKIIYLLSAQNGVSMITTFHPAFSELLAVTGGPGLFKKRIPRFMAVSRELSGITGDPFFK